MPDAKNPVSTKQVPAPPECSKCGTTGGSVQLHHCRICRKRFCDDCAFRSRTGPFCSQECSERFFYGEIDDEESEDMDEE